MFRQQRQQSARKLSKDTERLLKDLKKQPPATEISVKNQQRITLSKIANDFSSALNNYQRVQRECIAKEKFALKGGQPGVDESTSSPSTLDL